MDSSQGRLLVVLATLVLAVTAVVRLWPSDTVDPGATEFIWELAADDIRAVRLQTPADAVSLERAGEVWRVTAPYEAVADAQRMAELLDSIREIGWGTPVQGAEDAAEFGLDPARALVEVTAADGTVHRLPVGDDAVVGYQTYARAPSGTIVTVRGSHSTVFTEPSGGWRDHTVFTFDPAAVRRVTVAGPEGVLSVYGETTRWWLADFTRAAPEAVDNLVLGLLDIRAAEFVESADPIADSVFTVRVDLEGGDSQTMLVGERAGGGIRIDTPAGQPAIAIPQTLTLLVQGPTDVGDPWAFVLDPERVTEVHVVSDHGAWIAVRSGPDWLVDGQPSDSAHAIIGALDAATIQYRREPVPEFGSAWRTVHVHTDSDHRRVEIGSVLDGTWRVARDLDGGEPYLIPLGEIAVLGD
ncbi:MAG: hypothetical protein ACI8PZ_006313 [Myxococcota bacterium]